MTTGKTPPIHEPSNLIETNHHFFDESGFVMDVKEVSLKSVGLRWGSYKNPSTNSLITWSGKYDVTTHFQLLPSGLGAKVSSSQNPEFVVYRESAQPYDIELEVTQNQTRHFFEVSVNDNVLHQIHTDDSAFLKSFSQYQSTNHLSPVFTTVVTTKMFQIIREMESNPYTGYLKNVYLETKAIELLLAQVYQLDHQLNPRQSLKHRDINTLTDLKNYIDLNLLMPMSVTDLAREAGINQTKLKAGFKQLFNCTLFEYIRDQRLQRALQLLTSGQLTVSEVAYAIGYQHPQHFTAAFKKKYGIVPSRVKA